MKMTTPMHMRALRVPTKAGPLTAGLLGAAAILFIGAGDLRAAEAAEPEVMDPASAAEVVVAATDAAETLPAALTVEVAAVPLPLARPVQSGEIELVGVGALAEQYALFQRAVTEAISSPLKTPAELRRLLDKLRFSEAGTVAQAWLAHRGLIAAHDPTFAEGVRRAVARHGAIAVLKQLTGRGSFARDLHGANTAVAAVMAEISADNQRLSELRSRFLSVAQTFQGNRWGMIDKPSEPITSDFAQVQPANDEGAVVEQFASALSNFSPISSAQAYVPVQMERVLAYGARHLIATSLHAEVQTSELAPPARNTTSCLNWAKLNLNQCIAAAHFPSEEAWCAGTHAIEDVRACWAGALPTADR